MRLWLMFLKELLMIYMDNRVWNNFRKLHLEKEVILEHKCGFLSKNSTLEVIKCIVSEGEKYANTVKVQEIKVV